MHVYVYGYIGQPSFFPPGRRRRGEEGRERLEAERERMGSIAEYPPKERRLHET
jgi:hypothetical protein